MAAEMLRGKTLTKAGIDARKDNKLNKYNGVRNSLFPHAKREGIASIMDSGIKRSDAKKRMCGLRHGAVNMKFYNEKGDPIEGEDASLNIGGMTFTPDETGNFRLVDEKWLNAEADLEFERRKYIATIAKKMVPDEILAKTLGVGDDTLKDLCTDKATGVDLGMTDEVAAVNCLPNMVDSYVEGSQIWSLALAKQRHLIKIEMPTKRHWNQC